MTLNEHDTLHGFTVNRIRELKDCSGTLYEMTHDKTGAELIWLKRQDENKTFCIGFKTIPEDDSGVFHICEHSVLNGSRKYPVREPFVDLLKSSMQTFLNAMTYPDKTIYPVSSRNPQDYLNLMDVYLDAVLHPAIYTNPNIFYQEGWHYEIRDEADDPIYKGVVLNEMKGAFSSVDEVLMDGVQRLLFPDTCYRFEAGGDPEYITDLSYEQFLAAHAKYYHPSNSRTVLDGDLDIDAALSRIDSFFSEYEKEEITFEIETQKPIEPSDVIVPYEIGAEEGLDEKTEIAFGKILCSYDDAEQQLAWRVLSTVLTGSNEAPLKKAIIGGKLGQDVELEVIDELKQPYLLLVIRNTDQEKREAVRNAVHDTIQEVVEHGIRKNELRAILNQMEFHYREQKEPAGVMYAATAYKSWMYGGDPALFLSIGELYESLRQKADTSYFEDLLREGLLNDASLSMITAVPDPNLAEKRQARENEKLKNAKASWNEEIRTYIERNRILDEWQAEEDTPEAKATLPKLLRSDVAKDPRPNEPTKTERKGVPVLLYPESDNGVVYMNVYFNIAGVTRDHLAEVSLLADLLMRLRTEDHTLPELQEEIRGNLGTLGFSVDAFTVDMERETAYPVICVSTSVLKQNLEKAVDLILEILKRTVFEKDTVFALLQQSRENYRQMFINGGHAAGTLRAGAHTSAANLVKEYFNGYSAAKYVTDLSEQYETRYEEVLDNCAMYCAELFSSSRMTLSITGEENLPTAERLIDSLPRGEAQRAKVHYPLLEGGSEGILVPAQVSYTSLANNLQLFGYDYCGTVRVAAQMLTFGYLWNEIRVKGGAYGTGFAASPNGNIACWSFRDPTPEKSLTTYRSAADSIEAIAESGEDLTSYIIGTIASAEPLQSNSVRIRMSDARWFSGITYEVRKKIRSEILNVSHEDLRVFAKAMKEGIREGTAVVVGSREALEACGVETILTLG
ncbi:MAG: insulinase family protein [Solobacterium sp.]|nr:insulinase family protein [Solobacterium sp.]